MDTGADLLHPDLKGRITRVINVVDTDERQFMRDRHGTEVAGVIAATANNHEGIVGVAPHAQLMLIKACWQLAADADPARCNTFTLAQGIVAALDAGANVVNWASRAPRIPLLHSLIAAGLRRGVLFVGAAPGQRSARRVSCARPACSRWTAPLPRSPAMAGCTRRGAVLTLMPRRTLRLRLGFSIATAQVRASWP
ncbi:MAG: S8 family serine peptidase [Steroidobacteraceae bacterium]